MAPQESASLWQRAEMLGGIADEIARLTGRLGTNFHIGHEGATEKAPERPRRSGLDGYLEDTYDELCAVRDGLQSALSFVGQSGEGPHGELKTSYPEVANAPVKRGW